MLGIRQTILLVGLIVNVCAFADVKNDDDLQVTKKCNIMRTNQTVNYGKVPSSVSDGCAILRSDPKFVSEKLVYAKLLEFNTEAGYNKTLEVWEITLWKNEKPAPVKKVEMSKGILPGDLQESQVDKCYKIHKKSKKIGKKKIVVFDSCKEFSKTHKVENTFEEKKEIMGDPYGDFEEVTYYGLLHRGMKDDKGVEQNFRKPSFGEVSEIEKQKQEEEMKKIMKDSVKPMENDNARVQKPNVLLPNK